MEAPTLDRTSVPRITPWFDLRTLKVDAREGFLVSRIDGYTTLGDLATMTGSTLDDVVRIAQRLAVELAIFFGDRVPDKPVPKPVEPAPPKEPTKVARKKRPRKWTDDDLAAPSDLDEPLRVDVLDLHGWLDDMDHYELLGVPREADRKAIKGAYYALAARFHTDRYYGKNLGAFKPKMEQLFARITAAHDTLAAKQRRAEYDAYLVDVDRTRAFEAYLNDEPEDLPPPESKAPLAAAVPAAAPSGPNAAPVVAPAAPAVPAEVLAEQKAQAEDRARREALARKLSGRSSTHLRSARPVVPSLRPPPEPSSAPPPRLAPSAPPTVEQSQAATEALRRRYEDGVEAARRAQARKLLDEALAATDRGDVLAAANHYRLAVRYTDDPAVHEAAEIAGQRAKDLMADTYLKQAKYEEQAGKFGAAALSYAKAAEGRPDDVQLLASAARCLRVEGRDLHKAAQYAQAAVQKNPSHAPFRVTLGAIYLDAGLFLRARSELEQAAKLDPNHKEAKDLLARARRLAS